MSEAGVATDNDQASGLRRLLGKRPAQAIAFVAARDACGRTTLLAKTALALGKSGLGVVLIDENTEPDNLHSLFHATPRHDLLDLVNGQPPADVCQTVAHGVRLLSAQRFAVAHRGGWRATDPGAAERFDIGLLQVQQGAAFVLVDAARDDDGAVSPLALAARHLAVVVAARSDSITEAYALIKRLARERVGDIFHIVITRARNDMEALAIFRNMRRTAHEHLGVRLDYLAGVETPEQSHLADRLSNRLPLDDPEEISAGFSAFLAPRRVRKTSRQQPGWHLESVV